MSMTVKDVIKWLQTLAADDAIYIDEGGLSLVSEKDDESYLEVGGSPHWNIGGIECLKCHRTNSVEEYEISDVTGSRVCPECGYEGGKLSAEDSGEHQDEWDSLFDDEDEEDEED